MPASNITSHHLHFNSATELADWFTQKRSENGPLNGYHPTTDHAHATALEGVKDMREGTLENLDKAQSIVDELSLHVDTSRTTWQMDIQGAFPDVPTFLAGVPENMWNMLPDMSDKSPLIIWIGLTSQGNVEEETLIQRGATLAAFVLAMVNQRPVTLRPYIATGGSYFGSTRSYRGRSRYSRSRTYETPTPELPVDDNPNSLPNGGDDNRAIIISWDIQTSPMVLSELMTIARPQVTRYFGIEACQQAFGKVATNDTLFHPYSFKEAQFREALGVAPGDLYLPQITSVDPMVTNPLEWVRENVARFSEAQETGTDGATDYMTAEQLEAFRRGY